MRVFAAPRWRDAVAVLCGGMIGTAARLGIDQLQPATDLDFPLATLMINVTGSFLLGLLASGRWPGIPRWLGLTLGAGALGTFTTFSAVTVAVAALSASNQWTVAVSYLLASMTLGLAAAALGLWPLRRPVSADRADT